MHVKVDDLSGADIHELLQEHLRSVALHSPPESVHALDLDALRAPARKLYVGFGFSHCEPFADYVEDPYSVFMTRQL